MAPYCFLKSGGKVHFNLEGTMNILEKDFHSLTVGVLDSLNG